MSCPVFTTITSSTQFLTLDNIDELVPSTDDRTVGTRVNLQCQNGFTLVGASQMTCRIDRTWSENPIPSCQRTTSTPASSPTSDGGLDEQTKILIGVVAAVAGIIVIALIIMICYIWARERKRKREEKDMIYGFQDRHRHRHGPPTVDSVEMYGRGKPPAPYDYDDYRSRDRDYDRGSRLQAPMYLPERSRDDHYEHYKRSRKPKYDDFEDRYSDPGRKPYVRDWVKRSSMGNAHSEDGLDRPSVHMYGRRDPYLWRNSKY